MQTSSFMNFFTKYFTVWIISRFVYSLPYLVCSKRTAISRSLANMIQRGCAKKSNPTDLADQLRALKAENLSLLQLQVYGMQQWAKKTSTLNGMFMGKVVDITAESIGIAFPGDALIRHFFMDFAEATEKYKISYRQQNIPMKIGSIDAHFKYAKSLPLPIVQTIWSNDIGAPVVTIFTSSASHDDVALVNACADYNAIVNDTGMQQVQLMFIDNPGRDTNGTLRLFPSLRHDDENGIQEKATFMANFDDIVLVDDITKLKTALDMLTGKPVIGFDLEWKVYFQKGKAPGKTAVLQLAR